MLININSKFYSPCSLEVSSKRDIYTILRTVNVSNRFEENLKEEMVTQKRKSFITNVSPTIYKKPAIDEEL